MSKLSGRCGYVIRDTHYDLPYKGHVRRDQDDEYSFDVITRELALLTEAIAGDQREEWISRNFLPGYPRDVSTEGLISDYLSSFDDRFVLQIFECENCGRLWVQKQPQDDAFFSYSSDSGASNRVLASTRSAGPPVIDGRPPANSEEEIGMAKKPGGWISRIGKRFSQQWRN